MDMKEKNDIFIDNANLLKKRVNTFVYILFYYIKLQNYIIALLFS